MKNFMERVRADVVLSAVLCVILGVIVIVWPSQTTKILCWILAAVLIVMGVGHIISYISNRGESRVGMAVGFALLMLGAWILVRPVEFTKLFPIIVGVLLLMHGLEDLKLALETRQNGDSAWWTLLVVALINFLFGIILVWKAFEMVEIAMVLLGVALIYDGVSDIYVVCRTVNAVKLVKQKEELEAEYAKRYSDSEAKGKEKREQMEESTQADGKEPDDANDIDTQETNQ